MFPLKTYGCVNSNVNTSKESLKIYINNKNKYFGVYVIFVKEALYFFFFLHMKFVDNIVPKLCSGGP